jgi:NAD(P)-dependent dehydrogenase (short-subunit alcohol dehydrogenase family)
MMELQGKVAVITGAGNGLGLGIAKKVFAEGARVALWDMNYEAVKKVAAELDPTGEMAAAFDVNITDEPAVQAAVKATVEKFGRLDILVNNAGISRHKLLEETTIEIWEQVIKVNLTGTFIACKAVAPVMKKQRFGKIVNIASLGGRTGRPGVGVNYGASKAGVIGITMTLARELGPDNIYWNAGRAVPKDGYPEDVADAVIFLASSRSDWVTGVSLDVNGGIYIK